MWCSLLWVTMAARTSDAAVAALGGAPAGGVARRPRVPRPHAPRGNNGIFIHKARVAKGMKELKTFSGHRTLLVQGEQARSHDGREAHGLDQERVWQRWRKSLLDTNGGRQVSR